MIPASCLVAGQLEVHCKLLANIVNDALWCESHDTQTIYNATWLMQPLVYDEPFFRLRDVCKLYLDDQSHDPNDL